ncbi:MAG: ABC transporter permease [Sarcina sp.]
MNKISNIALNRLKRATYNKKKFILMLFVPIIASIIGVFANSFSASTLNIGVISNQSTYEERLNSIENINAITINNKENLTVDLIMGKYDLILNMDSKNSHQNIRNIENINIDKLITDITDTSPLTTTLADYETENYLTPMNKTISFLMLMLFITCTLNSSTIILDKKQGILDRIKTSSSKPINYILGNTLFNFGIAFFQALFALFIAKAFNLANGISLIQLALVALLISLVATTFATLMGTIFDNDLYANLTASLVSLLLSLFGGTFIPFENMPKGLQAIGNFSPTRWFVQMTSQTGNAILPFIFYTLIFSGLMIFISINISKKRQ